MIAEEKTFFKTKYTEEELAECYAWFEKNMDHLPVKLKMSHGLSVKDTRVTASNIIRHLRKQMHQNGTFNGEFAFLLKLREQIRQNEDFHEET